ncbi:G-type lectin S-receptor-like serine/threonine-protein kinase At1g11410 [Eucalyptus grandis]|uniref:G-type lectin S-receptor-like serine/threonine-protein kinase At1g11410 n=1 Tax=Eucalyptus grandis TaxID=71139 RepID=UPI00192F0BF2|nr:G-type lectin S-receptor-like serine/threonine-protein kinase At1g11410 [Eucalyptus grandis]
MKLFASDSCCIHFRNICNFQVLVPSFTARTLVKTTMVATMISVSAVVLLLLAFLMYCLRLVRKRDRRGRNHLFGVATSSTYFNEIPGLEVLDSKGRRKIDIPVFDFETVAAATSNFSFANKLGQGGFGSVYKVINLPIQLNPNGDWILICIFFQLQLSVPYGE